MPRLIRTILEGEPVLDVVKDVDALLLVTVVLVVTDDAGLVMVSPPLVPRCRPKAVLEAVACNKAGQNSRSSSKSKPLEASNLAVLLIPVVNPCCWTTEECDNKELGEVGEL